MTKTKFTLKTQVSPKVVAVSFGVLVLLFAISFYIFAWTEPSTSPPGGNVPAPLNVGNIDQYKSGKLGITTTLDPSYGLTVGNSSNNLGIKVAGPSYFESELSIGSLTIQRSYQRFLDTRSNMHFLLDSDANQTGEAFEIYRDSFVSANRIFEVNASQALAQDFCTFGGDCLSAVGGAGFWAGSGNNIYNTNPGNVEIRGNILGKGPSRTFAIVSDTGASDGPFIELHGRNSGSRKGELTLGAYSGGGATGLVKFMDYNGSGWDTNMVIGKEGNVGIGKANPNRLLTLNKSSGDPAIGLDIGGAAKFTLGVDDSDSDKFKIDTGSSFDYSNNFVINSSGYVGIGDTDGNIPQYPLHIRKLDGANDIAYLLTLEHDSTGSGGAGIGTGVVFKGEYGGSTHHTAILKSFFVNANTTALSFLATEGNLEREVMRIQGHSVGIGTQNPQEKLDVEGNIDFNSNQAKNMRLHNSSGAPVACDSAHIGYIYFDTSDPLGVTCVCLKDGNWSCTTKPPGAPNDKLVFVTSTIYPGDLRSAGGSPSDPNGLRGGDNICQERANAAGIGAGRTFKAWLSICPNTHARERIQCSNDKRYVMRTEGGYNYVVIANNCDDLIDNSIGHPIDHDEFGLDLYNVDPIGVWTNTWEEGLAQCDGLPSDTGDSCNGWTYSHPDNLENYYGNYGTTMDDFKGWTSTRNDRGCYDHNKFRLYCFEL